MTVANNDAEFTTRLDGRSLICVRGPDAATLLENTISNTLAKLVANGDIIHAGLLTPQGKILFAFFVVRLEADAFLLDTDAASGVALAQRLKMYKLRANAEISDATDTFAVGVAAGGSAFGDITNLPALGPDPRSHLLGVRGYFRAAAAPAASSEAAARYRDQRIAAGIAEPHDDYTLGAAFTHEVNWDETGSVDFKKGCFIGQEVVSRTRHKTLVRKRICRVTAAADIGDGATLTSGGVEIGTVLSIARDRRTALAMVRIDRAVTAASTGTTLTTHDTGAAVEIDPGRMETYRAGLALQAEKTSTVP